MSLLARVPALTRVKRERLERGMTQGELSQKIGLNKAAICRIEAGREMPSVRVSKALAELYGVDEAELFSDLFWWQIGYPENRLPKMPKFPRKGAE